MITLTKNLNVENLPETYVFANTPMYLFKRYRLSYSVRKMAVRTPVESLITQFNDIGRKPEKSLDDVVLAYAILVSFTWLNYEDAIKAFSSVDLSYLNWGRDIKLIFQTVVVPTSKIDLKVKRKKPAIHRVINSNMSGDYSPFAPGSSMRLTVRSA